MMRRQPLGILHTVLFAAMLAVSAIASDRVGSASGAEAPEDTTFAARIADIRTTIQRGQYREAESRARELLAEIEHGDADPLSSATAIDVLVEALVPQGAGRSDDVLALANRAVSMKEQAVGPEDGRTALSVFNLGNILLQRADLKGARSMFERALAVHERDSHRDDSVTGRVLVGLGKVFMTMGELTAAREYAERAKRSLEASLGREHPTVAEALILLAAVMGRHAESKASVALSERAIALVRQAYGSDHPSLPPMLGDLAYGVGELGEYERAETLYREAIAGFERLNVQMSQSLAWTLNNFGLLYWRTGDFSASLPLLERALSIWTAASSPDASKALNNLAMTYRRLGDFVRARSYYERSLQVKEKAYGPAHPEVALVVYNTANLLMDMGDFGAARPLYERAVRIREEKLGPAHNLTAYAVAGLGRVLTKQQEYAAARRALERAAGIWRERKSFDLAVALSLLGELSKDEGDLPSALRYMNGAREIYVKEFGEEYVDSAVALTNIGMLLADMGKDEDARQRFTTALGVLEKTIGVDHPQVATVTKQLAGTHLRLGDTRAAFDLALRSERISRQHFRLTSRTLSERQALEFAEERAPALDVLLTLAADKRLDVEQTRLVADAVIRSRALVLDEIGQRSRFRAAAGPDAMAATGELVRVRQRLANLIVRGPGNDRAAFAQAVDRARADADAAERKLAETSLLFRGDLARERAGVADVLASLPADAALVAFVEYSHVAASPPQRSRSMGAETERANRRYAALVARGGSPDVSIVPLDSATSADRAVTRWRGELTPSRVAAAGAEAAYRRTATALARTIWDPVIPRLSGAARVFIVPDGALSLVSFAALPSGTHAYLVETGPLIHYLAAERDLVPAEPVSLNAGILAMGDPAFGASRRASTPVQANHMQLRTSSECAAFDAIRFERLPATLQEVADVATLWSAHGEQVKRLSGAGATESALKEAAGRHRIIHLATHGFFLDSCAPAGPGTRGVGGIVPKSKGRVAPAAVRQAENPMALAGLVLAGANRRQAADPQEDDGILTAEEVATLDLTGVEWAVLSACDTGVGQVQAGEGVLGLRRAFTAAGVRTTIMSLWSVEDRSTRDWMTALYRARLNDRRSTSEAVQAAARGILEARRARRATSHPFFWGAFVAAGDWR